MQLGSSDAAKYQINVIQIISDSVYSVSSSTLMLLSSILHTRLPRSNNGQHGQK